MEQALELIEKLQTQARCIPTSQAETTPTPWQRACVEVDFWENIEKAARLHGCRARQARNALLPVQRLPIEIVRQVFETLLMTARRQDYYRTVQDLGRICRLWRSIVHHSPTVWSKIYCTLSNRALDEAFQKSAGHLLDVWFSSTDRLNMVDFKTFISKLALHTDRCRRLTLIHPNQGDLSECLPSLLSLPAPALERALLEDGRWETDLSHINLFASQADRLKVLEVDALVMTLNRIKHLSELKLIFVSFRDNPLSTQCGHLELPLLEQLSIAFDEAPHSFAIVHNLEAPSCNHLSTFLFEDSGIERCISRFFDLWFQPRHMAQNKFGRVKVNMANGTITLSSLSSNGRETLSLEFSHPSDDATALQILYSLSTLARHIDCGDTTLKLDDSGIYLLGYPSIFDALLRLPSVTSIDLGDEFSGSNSAHLAYWSYPRHFNLPSFPSRLRLVRAFHQPEECIFTVLKAIFEPRTEHDENRGITVEIYGEMGLESNAMQNLAGQIKEIVGETCTVAFIPTPRIDNNNENHGKQGPFISFI